MTCRIGGASKESAREAFDLMEPHPIQQRRAPLFLLVAALLATSIFLPLVRSIPNYVFYAVEDVWRAVLATWIVLILSGIAPRLIVFVLGATSMFGLWNIWHFWSGYFFNSLGSIWDSVWYRIYPFLFLVAILLAINAKLRLRLVPVEQGQDWRMPRRFSLRALMVTTVVFSVALAGVVCLRFGYETERLGHRDFAIETFYSLQLTVVVIASIWAVFANDRLLLRISVLFLTSILMCSVVAFALRLDETFNEWLVLATLQPLIMLPAIWLIRLSGYRLTQA